jgi:hypothetical protein
MSKQQDKRVRVVAVPRDKPDLDRLAKAIVALALKQLNEKGEVEDSVASPSSPSSDGAAA